MWIEVGADGYRIRGDAMTPLELRRLDPRLLRLFLRGLRRERPGYLDITLRAEDGVRYEEVITAADLLLGSGLGRVHLDPAPVRR
jgi:biopolymer transport protein ExbD